MRRQGVHSHTRVGGPPEAREWIADESKEYFPPVVDPTALIQSFVTVDSGCERPTRIGARALLMAKSHVGHDCIVGADVELATGAILGGYAEVHDGAKVGLNAVVLPFRIVGEGAVIGAGSVVTKNVPPNEIWCGNPARPIERNETPFTKRSGA